MESIEKKIFKKKFDFKLIKKHTRTICWSSKIVRPEKMKKKLKEKNVRKFLLRSLIDGRHGVEIFSIQSGWQINLQRWQTKPCRTIPSKAFWQSSHIAVTWKFAIMKSCNSF